MRSLHQLVVALSQQDLACSGAEVGALCHEVRRIRKALATVGASSTCGSSVRAAQRALRIDPLGVDDPDAAIAADGYSMRSITTFEAAASSQVSLSSGLSRRELSALIVEVRRLRQGLHRIGVGASSCPRTRRYAEKVLRQAAWAAADDARNYPPIPGEPGYIG